jgi:probable rRNA maturation factor
LITLLKKKKITADIFISIDSVKTNAQKFGSSFKDELHRVMIHGALHLVGYNDKTKEDRHAMRMMEDEALDKRKF